jgi:hypothetical protein
MTIDVFIFGFGIGSLFGTVSVIITAELIVIPRAIKRALRKHENERQEEKKET